MSFSSPKPKEKKTNGEKIRQHTHATDTAGLHNRFSLLATISPDQFPPSPTAGDTPIAARRISLLAPVLVVITRWSTDHIYIVLLLMIIGPIRKIFLMNPHYLIFYINFVTIYDLPGLIIVSSFASDRHYFLNSHYCARDQRFFHTLV